MHTVSIQPIASERLKHLETRGSNEMCGSLVTMSPIASERLKAVTLSRRSVIGILPCLGSSYAVQVVSALSSSLALMNTRQGRSYIPPFATTVQRVHI